MNTPPRSTRCLLPICALATALAYGTRAVAAPPDVAPHLATSADPYEEPVALSPCSAGNPEVYMIRSPADWASINDPALRVFCAHPGDYRKLGRIELTVSGSQNQPRVIRYYDPEMPERQLHPVHMAAEKQVRLQKLRLLDADHWIIDGIALPNDDPDTSLANTTVALLSGSSHNILQGLLVEGGRTGLVISGPSNHNVLQRSVVRNTVMTSGDANCINIVAGGRRDVEVTGNHIVSNEVYDCTDSLQLAIRRSTRGTTFPGTVVANNDFYLTPARYTDCRGRPDPEGACAAAEGRFDLKGGGTSSEPGRRVHVTRNRIWGSRKTDPSGLGGGGSWGTGLESCCYSSMYLLIERNVIFDVARGIGSDHTRRSTIRDNVISDVRSAYDGQGTAFYGAGNAVEFYRNVVIRAVRWGAIVGQDNDVRCNTFIDVAQKPILPSDASGLQLGHNAYYAASPRGEPGPGSIVFDTAEEAVHADLCFERRILTGPETFCIPMGRVTMASPHAALCDAPLGTRPGVGIDDEVM